jgi:23S rRNA (adenine1618-N6)-methyltransferase
MNEKRQHPEIKLKLHPRNKHLGRYDFKELSNFCSQLAPFVELNIYDDESIGFSDPQAIKMLNKALLKQFYNIDNWDIPQIICVRQFPAEPIIFITLPIY